MAIITNSKLTFVRYTREHKHITKHEENVISNLCRCNCGYSSLTLDIIASI